MTGSRDELVGDPLVADMAGIASSQAAHGSTVSAVSLATLEVYLMSRGMLFVKQVLGAPSDRCTSTCLGIYGSPHLTLYKGFTKSN